MADNHEKGRVRRREHRLERLHSRAPCLGGMEGCAAPGEDDPRRRKSPLTHALGDSGEPVRLRIHRRSRLHAGRHAVGSYHPAAMADFGFVRLQPVEFRDLDGLGHVNNAVYGSYLESAKVDYFREIVGVTALEDLGIVADLKITFRSPAFLGETLEISTRVSRVGTKSLQFEFEFRGSDGRMVAEASSVHVAFDYERREAIPVPAEWRRRIETHESRRLARA